MKLNRRSFLTSIGAAAIAGTSARAVRAIEPIRRHGGPRMKLSLAAYSFRQYLSGPNRSMTMEDFIDLAASYPLDAIEPTSYYFQEPIEPGYLRQYRRRAFLNGLDISGTAIGNTFTYPHGEKLQKQIEHTKRWIVHAADLGAPCIRIFAGQAEKGVSEVDARRWCIDAILECCKFAGDHGIILALENHGGIVTTADQILSIVKEVQSDWFGINLDTGNFRGPNPYEELERVAPYAVTVQIKVDITPQGKPPQEADFPRIINILRKSGYRGYVALEYEAKEDPKLAVPRYLEGLSKLIS